MTTRQLSAAIALIITAALIAPVKAQIAPSGEIRVMRADYFQNYAGAFLYVEVFDELAGAGGTSLTAAWRTASGSYGSEFFVERYFDTLATPHVYLYSRALVRVGPPSGPSDVPVSIRVTSGTGAVVEAPVRPWLATAAPPHIAGYKTEFFTHYMDPTEARADLDALGAKFPELISVMNLPERTPGYRRKAATVMGIPHVFGGVAYAGQMGSMSDADVERAVVLETLADGHDGGNDVFATFRDPGASNAPLSVSVVGNELTVNLATDAAGAVTSTSAQVINAINAGPGVAGILFAYRFRHSTGTGVVAPTPRSQLSDWLNAPASVQRGPFQNHLIRIGTHRDGSKIGVFIYCQQHANDWATALTCVEAAHRLAENYSTDPETKLLLDNVEVFMVPTVNPDGAHYALYDDNSHRKNLNNRCTTTNFQDPLQRGLIGVNLDRNNAVGSIFDGYIGAALQCTNLNYAGPFEVSEPESRNLMWVVNTFPNIKFSLNVQSFGGYAMWSPGASTPERVTLPQPNRGLEAFHFAVAESMLAGVKSYRNTAVLPERVGAMADVRANAAGNAADAQWYLNGVFAYTLAIGADRFDSATDGTMLIPVGNRPAFANEGHDEAQEFAEGIFGFLRAAYRYSIDTTAPSVDIVPNGGASSTPITARFDDSGEPSTIYYTLDGSTPTLASPTWDAERPRMPGPSFLFTQSTTVKWIAQDVKGNSSAVRTAEFLIDSTPPVTAAMISPAGVDGWNLSPTVTLTANDGVGSGVDIIQYRLDGGAWTTYSGPFIVTGDGTHALEYQSVDLAANTEAVQTLSLKVDATAPSTTAVIAPPAVNGWYVNPAVTLNASDGMGIGVNTIEYRLDGGALTTYTSAFAVAGDGVHALEYQASDLLGNGEAVTSVSVQVDGTEPAITLVTPTAGAVYAAGAIVPAAYTCSDATSGVSLCSGTSAAGASIDTATAGTHAFVVNAQDHAGNTRQVTVNYEVIAANAPFSMRGNGSAPGPNQQEIDFDFAASEDAASESGTVQISARHHGPPSTQGPGFDATSVDEVIFSNDPNATAGGNGNGVIDTVTFRGTGVWNGQSGYHYRVTAADHGEPGRGRDTFTIEITAPDGSVVFTAGGTLTKGNVQSTH